MSGSARKQGSFPHRTLVLAGVAALPLCAHAGGLSAPNASRMSAHLAHLPLQVPSPHLAVLDAQRQGLKLDAPMAASRVFHAPAGRLDLETEAAAELATRPTFPIRWQSAPEHVSPELVHIVKHFRHEGLPVVRLWQSGRNLLHIGLNGHGTPGIWFVQRGAD